MIYHLTLPVFIEIILASFAYFEFTALLSSKYEIQSSSDQRLQKDAFKWDYMRLLEVHFTPKKRILLPLY